MTIFKKISNLIKEKKNHYGHAALNKKNLKTLNSAKKEIETQLKKAK